MIGSSTHTALHPFSGLATSRATTFLYWTCTALGAFLVASGGLAYALAVPDVAAGVVQLGYPLYFVQLIGVWKVLGGLAIVAPGVPRLKEWAYAGLLFELTGAAVSNAFMGDSMGAAWWHVPAPLMVAALVVGSWVLRPASRRLPGPTL